MSERGYECAVCGELTAALVREEKAVSIGRRSAIVEDEHLRCDGCGSEYATPEQMERTQQRAVAAIRGEEGLLTPEEIIRIRRRYGLSQAQLEALLRTGPKTVVRWERGTVFQSAAADTLLRLLDRDPNVARILAQIAELPEPELEPSPAEVISQERDR
ncbi:MAG: type II toxin-antitoxin system MqsA family antitoxin [Gemmatimonadales bacterium]|jgi:HTH-type transcriptional regulator/antitoxin MqsA